MLGFLLINNPRTVEDRLFTSDAHVFLFQKLAHEKTKLTTTVTSQLISPSPVAT